MIGAMMPKNVQDVELFDCLSWLTILMAGITITFLLISVITKTDQSKPKIAALIGLTPLCLWFSVLFMIFNCTEIAYDYQGAIYFGLIPLFSMLT